METSKPIEVGYLYLPRCVVYIQSSDASEDCTNFQPFKSIDVALLNSNSNDSTTIDKNICSRCELLLQTSSELGQMEQKSVNGQYSSRLIIRETTFSRFDGTLNDSRHGSCQSSGSRKRSDANLLLGLALASQDLGHISIQSVKIWILPKEADVQYLEDGGRPLDETSTSVNRCSATQYWASLVITFAIPQLVRTPIQKVMRSIQSIRHSNRWNMSGSTKCLPACTQLILAIMRSDWETLDTAMERHEKKYNYRFKKGSVPSLFPSKLSLEEVYKRIHGAASSLTASMNPELEYPQLGDYHLKQKRFKANTAVNILNLPKDVLVSKIAPLLRARSLDSLRCSCRYMHHTLRAVVPGLKLRLYKHQVDSLYWMRIRETKPLVESDLLYDPSRNRRLNTFHDGDAHRAFSGGDSVLISPRNQKERDGRKEYIRISQYTGDEIQVPPQGPLERTVARGGLLCDDPGLGKTITVLSLILQTLGLSTMHKRFKSKNEGDTTEARENDSDGEEQTKDEKIFNEYWKEQMSAEFRCPALNRIVSDLLRSSNQSYIFMHPVDPVRDDCPDYFEVISHPICIRDIRKKINSYAYAHSFSEFEKDVERCFRNAMSYNDEDHVAHTAAKHLLNTFEKLVNEFKERQLNTAKARFARASAKPNSAVAALVDQNNRIRYKKLLVPSSATLLVVPSVLLEHWQDQLKTHVDLKCCTEKVPIIFEFTGSSKSEDRMVEIRSKCLLDKTHVAFAFVDRTGTKPLPNPDFLAMFRIVITTTQRFTNEWSNGSFQDEINQTSNDIDDQETGFREESCSLLKVNWLRMIVDEGHSMGRAKGSSAIIFASWITADRRWAMTGTPTRRTTSHSGLTGILNLLQYLQHGFFSRRLDGETAWRNLITRSWSCGDLASFVRLRTLLTSLMVRHTKEDIQELPRPIFRTTVLSMSFEEVTAYNTLVCAVQSNLLITSMQGKTSGAQDSLLHASQSSYARRALENIRLVCCGGTRVVPTLTNVYWDEFVEAMQALRPKEHKMKAVMTYISRAVVEELSPCGCCGMMLSTLLVFPCGDLVCTECVDKSSTSCLVCDAPFNVDEFQLLQPGMDYQWLHNIEEEAKKNKKKRSSAVLDDDSDREAVGAFGRHALFANGAGHLSLRDSNEPRRRTRKPGDGHTCEYDPKAVPGECVLCWQEHDSCNLMGKTSRCEICYRIAEACPESESKAFYIVDRLQKLIELQRQKERRQASTAASAILKEDVTFNMARPLKVIVFSQFRKVLNMIGHRLLQRFGTACVAEYWGKFRRQELRKFVHATECFCMLLGKDGSEGLDLSFVTHIIFLEQVWDNALENQVVARAWRMGAQGSVEVETLIAEKSVEATMRQLELNLEKHQEDQGAETTDEVHGVWSAADSGKVEEYQRAKLHFLLKGLELITNQYTCSFGAQKVKTETGKIGDFVRGVPKDSKKLKARRVRFQEGEVEVWQKKLL